MKRFKNTFGSIQRMLVIAVCSFISVTAIADNEKPITVNELPQTAQQILKKNFPNMKVALAKVDNEIFDKSYDVIFTDGGKVEFDKKGQWTEVKLKNNFVPMEIIPSQIRDFLKDKYPGEKVVSIERDSNDYELRLSNRFELTFNKQFKLIDIDD